MDIRGSLTWTRRVSRCEAQKDETHGARPAYLSTRCSTIMSGPVSTIIRENVNELYIRTNSIIDCNHIPFGHSDHDVLFLELKVSDNINFGKGYWKFNNSLLQDKPFVRKFTKYWLDLIEGIELSLELWDHLKEQFKNCCIHYSKQKKVGA